MRLVVEGGISGPIDIHFNLDPRIVLTRPANGIIDVWVGTYDGEYCNAVLSKETFSR